MRPYAFTLALLGVALLLPDRALALAFRLQQLPSAPDQCNTCHTMGGGTARNAFGLQVEATLDGSDVDWSAICALDADDDGFSNGEELGDPDCDWTIGQPARAAVSDPADPTDTPEASDAGVMMDQGTTDVGGSMDAGAVLDAGTPVDAGETVDAGAAPPDGDDDDGGGCRSTGPNGGALSAAVLSLGLVALARRRERRRACVAISPRRRA